MNWFGSLSRSAAVLACLSCPGTLVTACVVAAPDEDASSETEKLYGLGTVAKPWQGGNVPVCFKDPNNRPDLQAQVATVLEQTWQSAAHITFTGFRDCALNRDQVSVVFAPATQGVCKTNADCTGDYGQCVAGFCDNYRGHTASFGAGSPVVTLISDDASAGQAHFKYEVIHEFGHALGFVHEMQRPDNWSGNTNQCPAQPNDFGNYQPVNGGSYLTAKYDRDSIMNYCSPQRELQTQLSVGDIIGARSGNAYGVAPSCDFNGQTTCELTTQTHQAVTFSIPSLCPKTTGWVMKTASGVRLSNACANGAPPGSCGTAIDPTKWVLGYQSAGATESGPAIGSSQSYLLCDGYDNCSAAFSLATSDCHSGDLYLDPNQNPLSVTQGSAGAAYVLMAGQWIAADHGVNASGYVTGHNIPGASLTLSPGTPLNNIAGALLIVKAPLSTPAGNYQASVSVTDAASRATRVATIPIRVDSCTPATAATVCRSAPNDVGTTACGVRDQGCGFSVDCGGCASGKSCMNPGYCCDNGTHFDLALGGCVPTCSGGTFNCFDAGGACMTAADCQAFNRQKCRGRSCF